MRTVGNRTIALRAVRGSISSAVRRPHELRYHVVRELWALLKRFGAPSIDTVELRELPDVRDRVVEGFIDDPNRAVLAALCTALRCSSFFEIGTNRGRTAWTVARNNPGVHVYTLDLPSSESANDVELELLAADREYFKRWDRGIAFKGTPEQSRIEQVFGDSATFDFSPYEGAIDLVYVDGSHSYAYVKNDTEAALRMLSPTGAIAWDDYPHYPGVYAYLTDLAPSLDRPLFHIRGTRMVVYSRQDVVSRLSKEEYGSESVA